MARSSLRGSAEFKARVTAIKQTFKPAGAKWAKRTAELSKPAVPVKSGKGRRSVRVKNASQRRATVAAIYYVAILDKGAKAHTIRARRSSSLVFQSGGRTVFARKVNKPAQRGMHFAKRAADRAIRENPLAQTCIDLWNEAA